jgi:hypothetical protein
VNRFGAPIGKIDAARRFLTSAVLTAEFAKASEV